MKEISKSEELAKLDYMKAEDSKMPVIAMLSKSLAEEGVATVEGFDEHQEPQYIHIFRHAKVVSVSYKSSKEEMRKLLLQTNGLCFPGGLVNIYSIKDGIIKESEYTRAGRILIELAIEINNMGIYYPVYGVCLGFQLFAAVIAQDCSVVEHSTKAIDYNTHIEFKIAESESRILRAFTKDQLARLSSANLSYNYHAYYVRPESFASNKFLNDFFFVVGTSLAKDHSFTFATLIEGKKYPFYAVQHHPEWALHNFYQLKLDIAQTPETVEIANTIGDFFVEECRKNSNSFKSEEELRKILVCKAKLYKHEFKGYIYLI